MISSSQNKNFIHGGFAYFLMTVAYITLSFIGQSILDFAGLKDGTLFFAINGLITFLAVWGVVIYATFTCPQNPLETIGFTKCKPIYFAFALVLAVGMFFGLAFINGAISEFILKLGLNVGAINSISVKDLGDLIVYTLVFALLPALAEETFFRGVMLNGSSRKITHSVLITSVCFALYHGSFTQIVYQFIFGISFAFLTIKAKSVLPCVLAHFLNNFTILLLDYLNVSVNLNNGLTIALGLMLLAVFWVGILLYQRFAKLSSAKPERELTPSYGFIYGVVAIFTYVVLLFANLFA